MTELGWKELLISSSVIGALIGGITSAWLTYVFHNKGEKARYLGNLKIHIYDQITRLFYNTKEEMRTYNQNMK